MPLSEAEEAFDLVLRTYPGYTLRTLLAEDAGILGLAERTTQARRAARAG